jgi:hypothetical protein
MGQVLALSMLLCNSLYWLIFRDLAGLQGWRRLSAAEKRELPSALLFPINCVQKKLTGFFTLLFLCGAHW